MNVAQRRHFPSYHMIFEKVLSTSLIKLFKIPQKLVSHRVWFANYQLNFDLHSKREEVLFAVTPVLEHQTPVSQRRKTLPVHFLEKLILFSKAEVYEGF